MPRSGHESDCDGEALLGTKQLDWHLPDDKAHLGSDRGCPIDTPMSADVRVETPMAERNIQNELKELITGKPVVLFLKGTPSMPMCGFSARTVEALKLCEVPFTAINVLADPDIREGVKEYGQWPTVPQLYVGGELLGGCDITVEMYQNGELKPLLQAAVAKQA